MIVYKLTLNNGKQYVGITKYKDPSRRIKDHKRTDQPIGRALRKHGLKWFSIIGQADTWEELCQLEIQLIKRHNTRKPHGYNLTYGGEGSLGLHPTEATRKLMSQRLIGNKHLEGWIPNEETRQRMKLANSTLRKRSAISQGLKEKWKDPIWAEKMRKILRQNNERKRNETKADKSP